MGTAPSELEPCGKIPYESRRAAKQARARQSGVGIDRLRPYFCEGCDGWHLGHLSRLVIGGFKTRATHRFKKVDR